MSVATPTLLPRRPPFPNCLPQPPKPYPTALPRNDGYPGRMNDRRDLERELAELSAEEEEIEKLCEGISLRGYKFIVPIGRMFTQEEERADDSSDEEEDDDDDGGGGGDNTGGEGEGEGSQPSEAGGDVEESGRDLDADMTDMDNTGNMTATTAQTDLSAMTEEDADGEDEDESESEMDE